jgi:hypothetical protein
LIGNKVLQNKKKLYVERLSWEADSSLACLEIPLTLSKTKVH